jgi:hypothetical protein
MTSDCQRQEYGPTEANNDGILWYDMDIPVNDIMDMLLEKKSNKLKNWRLKKLDNRNVLFFKEKNYRDLTKP